MQAIDRQNKNGSTENVGVSGSNFDIVKCLASEKTGKTRGTNVGHEQVRAGADSVKLELCLL